MSGSSIVLDRIIVRDSLLCYEFHSTGEISKAFEGYEPFEIDYYEDISKVPQSILVIPFLVNVLPVAWVHEATITVPDVDKSFIDNVENIKQGYRDMYPKVDFGGQIISKRITDNTHVKNHQSTGLMFSGGVDATSSLITMIKSGAKPRLITIWGADVSLDDHGGWAEKSEHTRHIGGMFGLEVSLIKSSFREFFDEALLTRRVSRQAGDNWWHGFQHGIGIVGHAAPLAYLHKLNEVHIAASFVKGDKVTCASDPTIDEHVNMGATKVVHNGYDMTRQDKVANIHSYASHQSSVSRLPIKVCWRSKGAKNCGKCEKCMRTAAEIIAEGGTPSFYSLDKFDPNYMKKHLIRDNFFFHTRHWKGIQKRLSRGDIKNEATQSISWLLEVDFDTVDKTPIKILKSSIRSMKRLVMSTLPKPLVRKISLYRKRREAS